MSDVTQILFQIDQGDRSAAETLLPLVYDELRKLAAARLAQERPGQTLQSTALVHEAYIRLVDVEKAQRWNSRGHFFAAAAAAMRRILVETARSKKGLRRGGDRQRCELRAEDLIGQLNIDDLLDLNEALSKLASVDAQAAKLVELRVFSGMTIDEVAKFLGISPRTAKRSWAYARAWLRRAIGREDDFKP